MEGQAPRSPGKEAEPVAPGCRRDLALIGLLLVAAVVLRGWLLWHTEVAARDSIGFIEYALEFERHPWADVLRTHHQHPAYPLTILALSVPARALSDAPLADVMRFSAQLASVLAAVLLVVPMYFLGKIYFHRAAGFWAALLFQCLPVSSQILSDGLSESLFLLLIATGLLLAALALRGRSLVWFALCGAVCGLAYLTRPEGALLLAASLLSLVALQWLPAWRRPRGNFFASATALTLGALVAGSPYYLATGRFTNKPSIHRMFRQAEVAQPPVQNPNEQRSARPAQQPSSAPAPVVSGGVPGSLLDRALGGVWELGAELVKAFHYAVWAPALLGVWWFRRRMGEEPGIWPPVVLSVLYALVLWALATAVGYLSERHVLVLVLGGVYPAAAAAWELPHRLLGWLRARRGVEVARGAAVATLAGGALLVGLAGLGLPRGLQTLHARRAGYHAAGLWLAEVARPADLIFDRHAWAYYYAGRVFTEGKPAAVPPDTPRIEYHVIGKERERGHRVERDMNKSIFPSEQDVIDRGGAIVWHWPPRRPLERATVVVYAVPPPGKTARLDPPR